ncbi:ribbon-helix-helix CopG family protein [Pontibacter ummariensis]|uniref:Ribbon-helix-helix protein, copG family n=2 Tax=Pontibacter ummariensis TaxID=1610492 RepID=A0A239IYD1_9BACT|nr:ribbon-helix-helix CopG family protein [Pontibacter ummariensis]SNS98535.1 Ribbon-helix-helix protein, copG family [Pontibacter ummariensis]
MRPGFYLYKKMASEKKKTAFPIRLEEELLEKGKKLAERKGISLAGLFRQLLLEKLEEEEKK